MAAWEAFCAAWEVTRPRPSAGFFAEEADVLFFAVLPLERVPLLAVLFFAAGADFVLLALARIPLPAALRAPLAVALLEEAVLRGPLARVLAALLRLLAVVLLEAMVFAAWVLLEAVGFFAVDEVEVDFLAAVPLFAAGADFVLLAVALLLAVARVLLVLPDRVPLARVLAALLFAEAPALFFARVLAALLLPAALVVLLVGIFVSLLAVFAYSTKALIVLAVLKIISTIPVEKYCKKPNNVLQCSCEDERGDVKCRG